MNWRRDESIGEWSARIEANAERLEASPHYVYRAFDSYGHLLYVGCTVNVKQRMSAHGSQSKWFRFAETIAVNDYPSRSEARKVEAHAIATEGSYFNATQADIQRTQANRIASQRAGKDCDQMKAAYPFLSDADRVERYLAAREDAELGRQERAA